MDCEEFRGSVSPDFKQMLFALLKLTRKTFRHECIYRSYLGRSEERGVLKQYISTVLEKAYRIYCDLVDQLWKHEPAWKRQCCSLECSELCKQIVNVFD